MKRPLFLLAFVLLLVGVVLVEAVRKLVVLSKSPEAPTPPAVVLPVAKSGTPWHETDVVISLRHEPAEHVRCTAEICDAGSHWRVRMVERGQWFRDSSTLSGDPAEIKSRRTWLRTATVASPRQPGRLGREATVAMRCPANTPYVLVKQLMDEVASSALYRIEYAVTAGGSSVDQLLSARLPNDPMVVMLPIAHPGIRVLLDRGRTGGGGCERCVEHRPLGFPFVVGDPDVPGEMTPIAEGAAGDAQLTAFVRDALRRDAQTDVRIRAQFVVPFQAVIDAIEVLCAAGTGRIDFEDPR